jgi:hypothetical protein
MATFNERIQVVIDVVSSKATTGLKDFKSAIADAQGFTGKLKAGVGALKDQFLAAAASPAGMATAVTAAAGVAAKAVTDYANLGVAVGDFAAATGLATEDASRWYEVAGDLNVEVGALQSSLNKLNKSIDPQKFKELGVEIERTATGAVDVNGTFLNVIDRLREINDPAERARVGSQLLGKSWQSVAPLIARSAKDIKSQLEDVADVKVFSAEEAAKARKFDEAMKNLQDQFSELALTLGEELLPAVTQLAGPIADIVGGLRQGKDELDVFGYSGLEAFNYLSDGLAGFIDDIRGVEEPIAYTGEAITTMGDAAAQSQRYLGLLAQHTKDSADAASDFEIATRLARSSLKALQDQIDGRKSFIDLQIQLRDNADKIKEVEIAFQKGEITAEDYYLGVASAALESKSAVADYVSQIDAIPEDKQLELVATLDPTSPQAIINTIQGAFDSAQFVVRPNVREDRYATGSRRVDNVTINVTAPVGASQVEIGRGVHDALQSYYRNGGEP